MTPGSRIALPLLCNTTGKCQCRPPVVSPAASVNQLFYIDDTLSKCRFLVYTGAEVSVVLVPAHEKQDISSSSVLVAANGTSIKTYGKRRLTLTLGKQSYIWDFIIAKVRRPPWRWLPPSYLPAG